MRRSVSGFTLMELMIVVVIIGVLAAIAFPNYDEYVKRGHRTEGKAFLSDAAARQERYYAQNYTYADTVTKLYGEATKKSDTGKYTLTVGAGDGGYLLTANQQFSDTKCGNLSLNGLGVKGVTGTKTADECWR